MPTYEYVCERGHESELRQSMSDDPVESCPREGCGAAAERQISLGAGFVVHGSGSSSGSAPGSCAGPGAGAGATDGCCSGPGFT